MKAIWTVIGIFVLIHGYFYIRYGSPDPCEAATVAIIQQKGFGDAVEFGVGSAIKRTPEVIIECYIIAFGGKPSV